MRFQAVKNFILVLAVAILAGGMGYKLGTTEVKLKLAASKLPNLQVINKLPPTRRAADLALFWKVWDELETKYVDKSKLDSQKMVYGAISGMVASIGDPYTMFLPPKQNEQIKDDLNGSFEGIGAELGVKDSKIVVIAPLPESPAEKAGVLATDWILKVDGADISNLTLPEVVSKIRGKGGTTVVLTLLHSKEAKPVDVSIIRDKIVLKSVSWKLVDGAAHIQLSRFGDQTNQQWDKAVNEINSYAATNSGTFKGVVLDLRNNPGGLLVSAVYVASEFLESGVVVKQEGYNGSAQTYSVDRTGKMLSVPLVAIVNQGTASASEILVGSLQAVKRAKVVGVQSFGKGSVQEAEDLDSGAGLHLTVAKWLLSNGVWINGTGLTPDVKIESDTKDLTNDTQLKKAIEILGK
ncbi:S41 family peptidase [Candidatus Microgenomates bacterium]|nr:S41 family peptidase [Candidatus Microgenomates bacterium]